MRHSIIPIWASLLLCLSLTIRLTAQPGTISTQYKPNGSTQMLQRQPIADGVYYIKVLNAGKHLGVAGVDTRNGAALIQWDFANQANHKFELKNIGNNVFTLKALHSNRYLNVAGQSQDNNAPIIQWDYVDQANLHFSLIASGNGYSIRCEQSQKYWHLQGGNGQSANGIAVVQFDGKGAIFSLESANQTFMAPTSPAISGIIEKSRQTTDGHTIVSKYRVATPLNSTGPKLPKKGLVEKEVSNQGGGGNCQTTTVKISLEDDSFMSADIAAQLNEIVPGTIFDVNDYLNGSWKRQETFLKPITLSADVVNLQQGGDVVRTVPNPTKPFLQQAVAQLYGAFSTDPNQMANLTTSVTIREVNNEADFQMQVSAGAHYFAYSVNNLFSFQNKSRKTRLLIDIIKPMFIIEAHAPQGGFFTDPALNQAGNLVYLKKAEYGMRILASVESNESIETIANRLDMSVDALFASGSATLDVMSRNVDQDLTIKMYVVGGQSRDVIPAYDAKDLKTKVERMAGSLTYQTCKPIRYIIANTRDNYIVNYHSATDEFVKQNCGGSISLRQLSIEGGPNGGDLKMYGKVWAMAYQADGKEVPALNGQNMLLDLPGGQGVDLDNKNNRISSNSLVRYEFPPGSIENGYIEVHYGLFEEDASPDYAYGDGDDDHFTFRNFDQSKGCETGKMSRRVCTQRFYLKNLNGNLVREEFAEQGSDESVVVSFQIK